MDWSLLTCQAAAPRLLPPTLRWQMLVPFNYQAQTKGGGIILPSSLYFPHFPSLTHTEWPQGHISARAAPEQEDLSAEMWSHRMLIRPCHWQQNPAQRCRNCFPQALLITTRLSLSTEKTSSRHLLSNLSLVPLLLSAPITGVFSPLVWGSSTTFPGLGLHCGLSVQRYHLINLLG